MSDRILVSFLLHKLGPPRHDGDVYSLPPLWLGRLISRANERSCTFARLDRVAAPTSDKHKVVVALTFDDGYESDLSQALPYLEERSVPATFFVVPALIGQPGYLRWDQVRTLAQAGMAVGSHSLTHACLPELPARKLRNELATSRQLLQEQLGAPVTLLSVPGGFFSRRVLETAWEVGYTIVGSSNCGIERLSSAAQPRRWVVKRNGVDLRTSWDVLDSLLQGHVPMGLLIKQRSKRLAARLIGPSRYGRLSPRRRRVDLPLS